MRSLITVSQRWTPTTSDVIWVFRHRGHARERRATTRPSL